MLSMFLCGLKKNQSLMESTISFFGMRMPSALLNSTEPSTSSLNIGLVYRIESLPSFWIESSIQACQTKTKRRAEETHSQ